MCKYNDLCDPGSIPEPDVICGHGRVEFAVGSPPCFEGYSPSCPVLLPTQ